VPQLSFENEAVIKEDIIAQQSNMKNERKVFIAKHQSSSLNVTGLLILQIITLSYLFIVRRMEDFFALSNCQQIVPEG